MGTTFVPPTPDQWQGPAKDASFVPPSPDQWEGPSKGGDPKYTVGGFLGNAVSSAGNVIGGLAKQAGRALIDPIGTGADLVTGAAKMGMGVLEKGVRPIASEINRRAGWVGDPATGSSQIPKTDEEKQVDALVDQYKQRYGGLQNIADTLYTDPAGVGLDASAVLTGGEGLLGKAAEFANAAKATRISGALRTGADVANKVNPASLAYRGAAAVANKFPNATAKIGTAIQDQLLNLEPHDALVRAIKPRSNSLDFKRHLESAGPDMYAAAVKPIENVDAALDALKQAKTQNRAAYDQFRGPANQMGTAVQLHPVADLMDASIPQTLLHEAQAGVPNAVSAVKSLRDTANAYRTQVPLEKAEKILQEANAELDSYHAKYPREQWAALQTNPETAGTFAKAKALRDAIYNALDAPGQGAAARELQRRYGSLLDVEEELLRRKNVAARQQPMNIPQQMGGAEAVGDIAGAGMSVLTGHPIMAAAAPVAKAIGRRAAANWYREQQTTDNLIKNAFKNYPYPAKPFPVPTPVNISGALGPGPKFTPPPDDTSGPVPSAPPPAPAFRTGFPATAPKQLGPATPAAKQRGTPQPYNSSPSVRAAPAPGAPFPVQQLYSEQQVRQIASQAGKNPDAAVELAKKHGILKPTNFLDVEPIQ